MAEADARPTGEGDGELPSAESLGLSALVHREVVASTMDLAHDLAAAGAPAGTLVLADRQAAGRGRGGHSWASAAGAGVWMTLIARGPELAALDVLALRIGLAVAEALTPLVRGTVRVKWPNDVFLDDGKVAGILVETRWRERVPEWLAIGVGINRVVPDDLPAAAAVGPAVPRHALLSAVVPRLVAVTQAVGHLTPAELAAWSARDLARGRWVVAPVSGQVTGISADGSLTLVDAAGVAMAPVRSGSLRFA
ncbi:MAG: biotin--[acetyl-CoA-carboxylase] ligase [Gemmatimonadaceae bacterium]